MISSAVRLAAPGFPGIETNLTDHVQDDSAAAEGYGVVAVEGEVADLRAGVGEFFFERASAQGEHLACFEHAAQGGDDGRFGFAVEVRGDLAIIE